MEDVIDVTASKDMANDSLDEIMQFCSGCPAWSGSDCTRNPYTEGCIKDIYAKE